MDGDLLRRVDDARGLVPRGAWIKAAVSAKLGDPPVEQYKAAIRYPGPEDAPVEAASPYDTPQFLAQREAYRRGSR